MSALEVAQVRESASASLGLPLIIKTCERCGESLVARTFDLAATLFIVHERFCALTPHQ